MSSNEKSQYGIADASYQAAGREPGIRKLVNEFFDRIGSDARVQPIYDRHS